MNIRQTKALCATAQQRLDAQQFDPRKLALLHTGAAALLSLLLTVLNFVLGRQMDGAGGLSGLGLRSILTTAQSMLSILSFAIIPFWELGLTAAGLDIARGKQASPATLLTGFQRWGGVLRLTLLRLALYLAIMIACAQVASIVFAFTPYSVPFSEAMLTTMETGTLDEGAVLSLLPSLIPLYVILGIVLCVVLIPILYRLRMAEFALLDDSRSAALPALVKSWRLMQKNCTALFRLDLKFWPYYALSVLASMIGYADLLLPQLGISLPVGKDAAFFLFYFLQLALQLGLAWVFGSKIITAYAAAYESLQADPEAKPKALPQ